MTILICKFGSSQPRGQSLTPLQQLCLKICTLLREVSMGRQVTLGSYGNRIYSDHVQPHD